MVILFAVGVWRNVRKVGAWGKSAFNTVNSLPMGNRLMGRGIYKSPFSRDGNSGTVIPIAGTIVWLLERKRDGNSVENRLNIMENGLLNLSLRSRSLLFHLLA
ncbi:hypothetical protein F3Y22_tig00110785pilonHSYRG00089 [Hibiscus syriacus]|uniref:Uncharacterized protein n=1 Tax=Hibiscus syriacus TaxID=106335 RepID=A0A6A2ZQL8_HIBSY|nr:hypothetical protein F3Y22_tig00110785pilonHSYRG00089 [Hibiscus syriacus]